MRSKTEQFEKLRRKAGVEYEEMLFFDNEQRNCVEVGQLGVHCVYTPGQGPSTTSTRLPGAFTLRAFDDFCFVCFYGSSPCTLLKKITTTARVLTL